MSGNFNTVTDGIYETQSALGYALSMSKKHFIELADAIRPTSSTRRTCL